MNDKDLAWARLKADIIIASIQSATEIIKLSAGNEGYLSGELMKSADEFLIGIFKDSTDIKK